MDISYTATTKEMASRSFFQQCTNLEQVRKISCTSQEQQQDRVESRGPCRESMEPEDNSLAIPFNEAGMLGHNPCLESRDGS